nr:MAG TPA: DNA gyrase subunit A [Caudoviricetes sp.]
MLYWVFMATSSNVSRQLLSSRFQVAATQLKGSSVVKNYLLRQTLSSEEMMMQTKCGYCNKPVKPEEVIKSTLLYRNGSQLARKEKEYCSKRCASHDQMAHEG